MSNSAASVTDTKNAIDAALRARGGSFSQYSCKYVSWDDVSRGTVGGSLTCWGANITDTYLKSKSGESLFTVRPDNWNEKLGVVSAADVAMRVGNCEPLGRGKTLRNVTLKQFLENPSQVGGKYAGLEDDVSLVDKSGDAKVSVRFQTVFLPVCSNADSSVTATDRRQTFQFAAEAYSYTTKRDDDPRNLVILATSQGTALQADGAGAKRLLHHDMDADGVVKEYWLEAERSDHKVGGQQLESEEERQDAIARNKATSEVIGIKAMGTRFNCLMTIQVPLKQAQSPSSRFPLYPQYALCAVPTFIPSYCTSSKAPLAQPSGLGVPQYYSLSSAAPAANTSLFGSSPELLVVPQCLTARSSSLAGQSNAARVSRGDEYGIYKGLSVKSPKRNMDEHVTVTIVFYNTVSGGIPNEEDVIAAVSDMESLYAACSESGRLADSAFDFMKKEWTVNDAIVISDKILTQPPIVSNTSHKSDDPPVDADGVKVIVLKKLQAVKNTMSQENLNELRLVVLGALESDKDAVSLAKTKLDLLKTSIQQQKLEDANSLLVELRLLFLGSTQQ